MNKKLSSTVERTFIELSIKELVENDYNPRTYFDERAMERLCQSIEKVGLRHPLDVRPLDNEKYEIISGIRRYRCLKRLGWKTAPCMIQELERKEAILISIHENLQRSDLTPIEEAKMYYQIIKENLRVNFLNEHKIGGRGPTPPQRKKLKDQYDQIWSFSRKKREVKNAADDAKISASTISNRIHLLILLDNIQQAIHHGQLDVSFGYEIARLGQIKDQKNRIEYMMEVFREAQSGIFTVGQIHTRISDILRKYTDTKRKSGEINKITHTEEVSEEQPIVPHEAKSSRRHPTHSDIKKPQEEKEVKTTDDTKKPRDQISKKPRDQISKKPRDQISKKPRDQISKKPKSKDNNSQKKHHPEQLKTSPEETIQEQSRQLGTKKGHDDDWENIGEVKCRYCGKNILICRWEGRAFAIEPKPPEKKQNKKTKTK